MYCMFHITEGEWIVYRYLRAETRTVFKGSKDKCIKRYPSATIGSPAFPNG